MAKRNNALNFNRLSKYNFDYISLEEAILLEYLIFNYLRNAIPLLTVSRIESDTGIKKAKQKSGFKKLEEKGLINIEYNGKKNIFHPNLDKITHSIEQLFVKPNRYTYQYFYYVKNPEAFKVKKQKPLQEHKKPKDKTVQVSKNQMSLFD